MGVADTLMHRLGVLTLEKGRQGLLLGTTGTLLIGLASNLFALQGRGGGAKRV